jgi:hypothetical protein
MAAMRAALRARRAPRAREVLAVLLACVVAHAAAVAAPPPPYPPAPAAGATLSWFANRAFGSSTRAGHTDGSAGTATFASGAGAALALATDAAGLIYVADGPAIRVLDGSGGGGSAVSTLYTNSSMLFSAVCVDQRSGAAYALDGLTGNLWIVGPTNVANATLVASPRDPASCWWTACAVDALGGVLVADSAKYEILRVDPATGAKATLAGCGVPGRLDGAGSAACVHEVYSLSFDSSDNSTLFADYGNETTAGSVRRLSPNGTVSTVLDNLPGARSVLARGTCFHVMYSNLVGVFSLQVYPSTGAQFPVTLLNRMADLQTGAPPISLVVSAYWTQAVLITASAKVIYFIGPASPPSPPPSPSPPPMPNSPPPPEPPSPPVRAHSGVRAGRDARVHVCIQEGVG